MLKVTTRQAFELNLMNLLNKLNQTNKSEAGLYWPVSKYTVNAAQNIGQGLNSAKTKEQYKLLINFLQDVNQVTRPGFQTSTFPKKSFSSLTEYRKAIFNNTHARVRGHFHCKQASAESFFEIKGVTKAIY